MHRRLNLWIVLDFSLSDSPRCSVFFVLQGVWIMAFVLPKKMIVIEDGFNSTKRPYEIISISQPPSNPASSSPIERFIFSKVNIDY